MESYIAPREAALICHLGAIQVQTECYVPLRMAFGVHIKGGLAGHQTRQTYVPADRAAAGMHLR